MLRQIGSIRGTGLFHDSRSSPDFNRLALIFAENGRGKSTLAAVLHSCAINQGGALSARKTLDSAQGQSVRLLFTDATGGGFSCDLVAAVWTRSMPDLQVFDQDFVSHNVYSGSAITPDQRAHLLEFALGDSAVALKKKVDETTAKVSEATAKIGAQNAILKVHSGQMTVDAFCRLEEAPNADLEIAALEKRIAAANAREEILKKAIPASVISPTFNASVLFSILGSSLPQIEAEAERLVRAHLAKSNVVGFENWVSQGGKYTAGSECPYCGSDVSRNDLVEAYKVHFNKAYEALNADVAKLEEGIRRRLGDAVVDGLIQSIEIAQARIDGWGGFIDKVEIAFDADGMKAALSDLRALIEPLVQKKANRPLEACGTPEQLETAEVLWGKAAGHVVAANEKIQVSISNIEAYKNSLAAENVLLLKKSVESLKLRKLRHSSEVRDQVDALEQLQAERKTRADEKDAARNSLDALMAKTLGKYQGEINALLKSFGAQVQIANLGFDYRGTGLPRADYRLQVRGKDVGLAGVSDPAFGNALSESDKRALAFAFFVARLHDDPLLSQRIVVVDDPICSLDRRRRAATIRILKALAGSCRQLVVLAHEPYFLQALDDQMGRIANFKAARSYCKIESAANDYSIFGQLDLAAECASQYEKDLALVTGYVEAKPGLEPLSVATRLRVLIESSLSRQFAGFIQRNRMLGEIITDIEKAPASGPLAALAPLVGELRALNDYAKIFHHAEDEAPPDAIALDEGELRVFCQRALKFVLRG